MPTARLIEPGPARIGVAIGVSATVLSTAALCSSSVMRLWLFSIPQAACEVFTACVLRNPGESSAVIAKNMGAWPTGLTIGNIAATEIPTA
jgi:hypothetical protein